MNKPLLVVVTGRPASGKTTLAHIISQELKCPLISRDALKEGYVNTLNTQHSELDNSADLHIYETFFEVIELMVSKGISIIVEAAFQNKLWKPKLLTLLDKAEIRIVICKIPIELAQSRFRQRLLSDPERDKFHGDSSFLLTEAYEPVNMQVPTLEIDTTESYSPDIQKIIHFVQ